MRGSGGNLVSITSAHAKPLKSLRKRVILTREEMYILLPSPIPSHPCLLKVLLHTSVLRVDLSALVPACHSAFEVRDAPTPRPSAARQTETQVEPD
jgi:hypothetical protein